MLIILGLLELVWITVFFIVLYLLLKKRKSLDIYHRLRRHHITEKIRPEETPDIVLRIAKLIKRMAKPLNDWKLAQNLDFKLKQAGLPVYGAEFIIILIIATFLIAVSLYIVTLNMNAFLFSFAGVPLFAYIWIRMLTNKRRNAFTEQLGDCLTTVSNALRAGYSFQQAMDVVSKEMEPPISSEFERVSTDVAMGVALETALEQMNRRIGSADFDLVVTAVLIQREIGGNLAQILDTISDTINERIRMKREINALTAQGRFSAWVLVILPFIVAAFCWVFNHDQMQLFITEEWGRIALAVAVIMEFIGFVIIQRIVDIEL